MKQLPVLNRSVPAAPTVLAAGLLLLALTAGSASAKGRPAPPPPDPNTLPSAPAPGWLSTTEWDLSGNYVEACTDPPLCPSLFGSPSGGTTHRKVLVFQVTRGRWQRTDLGGLTGVAVFETPADRPLTPATRATWTEGTLFVPGDADSAQVEGLTTTIGLLLRGPGGPRFAHVEKAPLLIGLTNTRVTLDIPGRIFLQLRPAFSINGAAPNLTNLGHPFRFLGPLYAYEADTLYCAPGGDLPPVGANRRSGLVANFSWNSEVCYKEAVRP